ncbi:U3-containing 90S pre-ribosomal complex subunit-domain containing protein [Xylogone sp. PMI_703]|nr:U3-containing 90S pre-ribosomal complex subunit-domain containing protein [Xylogone sp. PMI_703]
MSVETSIPQHLDGHSNGSPIAQIPRAQNMGPKKRKRGSDRDQQAFTGPMSTKKQKPVTVKEEQLKEFGINNAIASMDNQLLADYVAQQTRRFEDQLSSIELEDKYISSKAILDTTQFQRPRSLDNLSSFLEHFSENPTKLWSASKKNGSPHTIIITAAGLRAADITRALRKFQAKESKIAKLFAKHIKIEDSVKFLSSTRTGMAVGTPTRIRDLIEQGALAIDRLERIVIDASYVDQKKRGILEIRETQVSLTLLLGRPDIKTRLGSTENAIRLLFF